jgi:hypothetical protein
MKKLILGVGILLIAIPNFIAVAQADEGDVQPLPQGPPFLGTLIAEKPGGQLPQDLDLVAGETFSLTGLGSLTVTVDHGDYSYPGDSNEFHNGFTRHGAVSIVLEHSTVSPTLTVTATVCEGSPEICTEHNDFIGSTGTILIEGTGSYSRSFNDEASEPQIGKLSLQYAPTLP